MTRATLSVVVVGALFPLACGDPSSSGPRDSSGGDDGRASETDVLCIPGTSIACTGKSACAGNQICRDDGGGYDRCECSAAGGTTGSTGGASANTEPSGGHSVGGTDAAVGGALGTAGKVGSLGGAGMASSEGGLGGAGPDSGGARSDGGSTGVGEGGTAGSVPECLTDAQCPADTACREYACKDHHCVATEQPSGADLPLAAQVDGDCKVKECNGVGGIRTAADDSDSPDPDANTCTLETCNGGKIVSVPLLNDPCGASGEKFCGADGACVTCVTDVQCPVGNACQARICSGGECSFNPSWLPDWNKCTTESCDPVTGKISHAPLHDCWQPIGTQGAPIARSQHVAVWTGSTMIVMRGSVAPGDPTKTGGVYDPVTNTWEATWTLDAPPAGWGGNATWYGGKMVLTGGYYFASGANLLRGARIYDHASLSWSEMSGVGSTGAVPLGVNGTVAVVNGWLVQWGGWPTEAWRFPTLTTGNSGSAVAAAPFVRARHSAVAIGKEMFVYGGVVSNVAQYAEGGHKYDIIKDTWAPIASEKPPLYPWRADHVAVAIGNKMLIWGGVTSTTSAFANETLTSTGDIYDPSLDSWTRMTMINAPVARNLAPFVWTGTHLIVWGGAVVSPDGQTTGTGGIYNPATDTWAATTSVNAPLGRKYHTAVWTGEAMLVWGGAGQNVGWLGDGALYYP
jgi:N-acetylneuraminic acid mutarotase